ncbi:MAG: DUF5668 domain-containing protein [Xanthomonadaceae bacterium]|jgi:hypothetical protein|nr:DUF5668 domain-containing protein [Xanthomonadaceae bacterium]
MKSNYILAVVLILVGAILLANNLGWTTVSLSKLVSTWWPAILIAVGAGMLFGRGK